MLLISLTLNLLAPTTGGARINPWATNFIYIELRGFSPRANYTDRAAAAGRRS